MLFVKLHSHNIYTSGKVLIQYSIPPILKHKLLSIGIGMKFLVSPTTNYCTVGKFGQVQVNLANILQYIARSCAIYFPGA